MSESGSREQQTEDADTTTPASDPLALPLVETEDTFAQHTMIGLLAVVNVMASNVGTMAQSIKALGERFKESETRNLWRWATLLVVMVGMGGIVFLNWQSVSILRKATSPEAQAAGAAAQSVAVQEIDCDDEVNDINLITHLSATFPQIQPPEMSQVCQNFFEKYPERLKDPTVTSTTTSTSAP